MKRMKRVSGMARCYCYFSDIDEFMLSCETGGFIPTSDSGSHLTEISLQVDINRYQHLNSFGWSFLSVHHRKGTPSGYAPADTTAAGPEAPVYNHHSSATEQNCRGYVLYCYNLFSSIVKEKCIFARSYLQVVLFKFVSQ